MIDINLPTVGVEAAAAHRRMRRTGKKRFDKPKRNNCLKMARFLPEYSWVGGG